MTIKRGKGQRLIPLEDLHGIDQRALSRADPFSCRPTLRTRLGVDALGPSPTRLGGRIRALVGNARCSIQLKQLLTDESDADSQAEIALRLGMTDNALKQAFHRFRQRYRVLLREEIGHTVLLPGDVEDELRHLIAVLRT